MLKKPRNPPLEELIQERIRTLRDVDSPVIGVVLNAVDLTQRGYNYSYQYYYHREGYLASPKPEGEAVDDDSSSMRPPPAPPN